MVKPEPIKICLVKYKEHSAMKFIWMITSRKTDKMCKIMSEIWAKLSLNYACLMTFSSE